MHNDRRIFYRVNSIQPTGRSTVNRIPILSLKILALLLGFATLLAACVLIGGRACPVDDKSFCEFAEVLEPFIESADAEAIQEHATFICCKGDYVFPDAASRPGFDPDELCLRSGAFRGAGACLTEAQLEDFLFRFAPLSIDHLIYTTEVFSELDIEMAEMAVLVSTNDPEWFLVIIPKSDSDGWSISAIIQISRSELDRFPEDVFVSWPIDAQNPNPIPRATRGVG